MTDATRSRLSAPSRIALALLSGGLYGLSFPPFELGPLAWVCLAPLFAGLRGSRVVGTLGLMWLWLIAASYSSGHWLPSTVETYYLQSAWVGWLFFFVIATLNAAPYYLPLGLALRWLEPAFGTRAFYPWVVAAAWVAAEVARGRLLNDVGVFISNPWAQLAYSQSESTTLLQITSVTGVYGVTFVMVSVSCAAERLFAGLLRCPRRNAMQLFQISAAGMAPVLLALVYGYQVLAGDDASKAPAGDHVKVGVVQANLPAQARWRSGLYGRNLETYLRLTIDLLQKEAPAVVMWPESSVTFFVETEPAYRRSIATVLGPSGTQLLAGGVRVEGESSAERYYNTIFSIGADGTILGRYDKRRLVPFGEYFPLRTVEFLRRRFEGARTFEPGASLDLLPSSIGPVAVATCNEIMLPEVVARRVDLGGTILLNPSNDGWAPEPVFADQMLDFAIFRAVEQRRWVVRASTTGPSALVDPWGRLTQRTNLDERGWIAGNVVPRNDRSLYGRVGDMFGLTCGILTVGALVTSRRSTTLAYRPQSGS